MAEGELAARSLSASGFPDYRASVGLKHVLRGFDVLWGHSLTLVTLPVAALGLLQLATLTSNGELAKLLTVAQNTNVTLDLITVVTCVSALAVAVALFVLVRQRPVYMIDFSVYKPPESWRFPHEQFVAQSAQMGRFTPASLEFQEKIIARSGLGQDTYLPPAMHKVPLNPSMANAREEFEMVMFSTVQDLLTKTGVHPKQIGILVVNCSLFNPTPSLAAMVINHFKMRSNIISYNLGGMGCSSSPISIDLARQMLQLYPHSYALVLSTENITQNWYFGNERSMLMPNCLFRAGGAAMLLSNRRRDAWRAKYQLLHTVRTHLGANDQAFKCIYQTEDEEGEVGVSLSKELMAVAGEALKVNVTTLGPLVLPFSEQILFGINLLLRKVLKRKTKPYIPDFKLAFDKVCIHTGGRAVIDEIEKQLKLTNDMVEPSRATLYRYGNTSSSSIWYILAHIESQVGLQRGERIWQLGFGSGFKCNSAVWRACRRIKQRHAAWEGFDVETMRAHLASLPNHHHAAAANGTASKKAALPNGDAAAVAVANGQTGIKGEGEGGLVGNAHNGHANGTIKAKLV